MNSILILLTFTFYGPNATSRLLSPGRSEDAAAAESVETAVQRVVGDGGQRVITIVTDQHGNLQPASLGQQLFFTLQSQQSEWAT